MPTGYRLSTRGPRKTISDLSAASTLTESLLSIDLEVDPATARIFAFAAVRGDGAALLHRKGDPAPALDRLEAFCHGASHLIGHNILRHDLPHLLAVRPRLAGLAEGAIDTLWLNPLAFPRNPYHRLVKHYHDGRLQAGHVNDPELDARLVLEVFANQIAALDGIGRESPDTLTLYHHLTTRGEGAAGFDAVFRSLRRQPAPSATEGVVAELSFWKDSHCESSGLGPEHEQT